MTQALDTPIFLCHVQFSQLQVGQSVRKKTHSDIACHSCVELSILARFYNFIQLSRVNLIQDFKRTALGRTLLNTYSLLLNSGTCQSKTQFGPWLESSSFGVLLQNFNRLVKIKSKDLRRPLYGIVIEISVKSP